MIKRLFSSRWVSGNVNKFIDHFPEVIMSTENPFLVISGPLESGKSTSVSTAMSYLYSSNLFSVDSTIYCNIDTKDYENQLDILVNLLLSISLFIKNIQSELSDPIKQEILAVFLASTKKLAHYETEFPSEDLVDKLEDLNNILKEDSNIRLKDLTLSSLLQVVEKAPLFLAFEVIIRAVFISSMEAKYGEESSEIIVKVISAISKHFIGQEKEFPLLRLENTHMFYRSQTTKDFYECLISSLIKKKVIPCIIEGPTQFGQILTELKSASDYANWFHFENYSKEETWDLWASSRPGMRLEDKESLWKACYGNTGLVHNITTALEDTANNVQDLVSTIHENGSNSVNSYLESVSLIEYESSLTEKITGVDKIGLRAMLYFIKNLISEQDQKLIINYKDFSANAVIQELVIQRLLDYNAVNEVLSFDKGFLPDIFMKSRYWAYTSSWSDMKRNKYAYEKLSIEV
jgi:hypothetical protein